MLQQCQSGRWQILDIGANVAYASVYLRLGLLANARVDKHVLVEPSQETTRILRKNLKSASIRGTEIIEAAVAARTRSGKLHSSNPYNKYGKIFMADSKTHQH